MVAAELNNTSSRADKRATPFFAVALSNGGTPTHPRLREIGRGSWRAAATQPTTWRPSDDRGSSTGRASCGNSERTR